MTGRVLIVDDAASDRIVLKVKLATACYGVIQADDGTEAVRLAREESPCLVVVSAELGRGDAAAEPELAPAEASAGALAGPSWLSGDEDAPQRRTPPSAEGIVRRLRADSATAGIPVIVTTRGEDAMTRLALFAAGADEVLIKPFDDRFLMARIRSLLRARDEMAELRLRESTSRVLGFAEGPSAFQPKGQVVLLTPDPASGAKLRRALTGHLSDAIAVMAPDALLSGRGGQAAPDVIVVDASGGRAGRETMALLPELRARAESRHAAIIVLSEAGAGTARAPRPAAPPQRGGAKGSPFASAVLALDLGANDIAEAEADPAELALRIQKQMRWKLGRDRLRQTVADGLNAAVTDPLTGLFNRRYAMHHLARIVDASREGGRAYAVLLIDLDHFKAVNDTHGHASGDAVLVAVAERLRENLRGKDLVARIGGEEFLVAMPDTGLDEARIAAERLCGIMRDCPIALPGGGDPIIVTTSIGLAMGGSGAGAGSEAQDGGADAEASHVMDLADRALYGAKSDGRAQVTVSQSAA